MFSRLKDSQEQSTRDRVFEAVCEELLRVRREETPDFEVDVHLESCLVADLGLDSLSLVEVVVGLEDALGIDHLSLEELNDFDCERVTVAALVDLCMAEAHEGALSS